MLLFLCLVTMQMQHATEVYRTRVGFVICSTVFQCVGYGHGIYPLWKEQKKQKSRFSLPHALLPEPLPPEWSQIPVR